MADIRYLLQTLADELSPDTGTNDGFIDTVDTSLGRIVAALPSKLGGAGRVISLTPQNYTTVRPEELPDKIYGDAVFIGVYLVDKNLSIDELFASTFTITYSHGGNHYLVHVYKIREIVEEGDMPANLELDVTTKGWPDEIDNIYNYFPESGYLAFYQMPQDD